MTPSMRVSESASNAIEKINNGTIPTIEELKALVEVVESAIKVVDFVTKAGL